MHLISGLIIPEELWPELRPIYPTFDFYGEVSITSNVTNEYLLNGYRMYARDPKSYMRGSTRTIERMDLGLTGTVIIPLSSVPEPLDKLIEQEILRMKKRDLAYLKIMRYADMDELSFNRKDF